MARRGDRAADAAQAQPQTGAERHRLGPPAPLLMRQAVGEQLREIRRRHRIGHQVALRLVDAEIREEVSTSPASRRLRRRS